LNSRVTKDFLTCFAVLPEPIKAQAGKAYRLWRDNPSHPGLHFKRVHNSEPIYSARIGIGWRVLGLLEGDTITWFWIGSHADYDRMLQRL
jgi:hypothetical protein